MPRCQVIRARTQHPNIHIRTGRYCDHGQALHALCNHVRCFQQLLRPGEGILIQCCPYHDVNAVANKLGIDRYTSKMEAVKKDQAAELWVSGQTLTIVAMSALGTGVHHPHCQFIIHFGFPYRLIEYLQEMGQMGQDGFNTLALLLYWTPYPVPLEVDLQGYVPLADMMNAHDCM